MESEDGREPKYYPENVTALKCKTWNSSRFVRSAGILRGV